MNEEENVKEQLAVDAAIELAIDEKMEEMKQAEAHKFHWEYRGFCVWCRRGRT
jgi:hypothetical protein